MIRGITIDRTVPAGRRIPVTSQNNSVLFNISNAYATKNTNAYNLEFITFSAWYYWYGGTAVQQLFKYGNGGYEAKVDRNGLVTFNNYNSVWAGTNSISSIMDLNKWTHIVFTCNSTEQKIYKNGVLINTGTTNKAVFASTVFAAMSYSVGAFRGNIAKMRVWSRVLGDAEVARVYNDTVDRTGLVGEWLMAEGTGTTLTDTSGSGNNLTLTNGPLWALNSI
jgi:hypothetical protein